MFQATAYLRSYLKFIRSHITFPETERELVSDPIQYKAGLDMQYYSSYQWILQRAVNQATVEVHFFAVLEPIVINIGKYLTYSSHCSTYYSHWYRKNSLLLTSLLHQVYVASHLSDKMCLANFPFFIKVEHFKYQLYRQGPACSLHFTCNSRYYFHFLLSRHLLASPFCMRSCDNHIHEVVLPIQSQQQLVLRRQQRQLMKIVFSGS